MRSWALYPSCCAFLSLVVVTSPPAAGADPEPTRKDSWITFLSRRTGDNLLYRMRPDGSGLSPIFGGTVKDAPGLAEGTSLYREPHWTWQSPDRKHFVSCTYDRLRPRGRDGFRPQFALHLGRTDGTGPTRVIEPGCAEAAAWSPDGKRVAYAVVTDLEPVRRNAARVTRVYVAAIDGTSQELVLERPGYWAPQDWSPDGKWLLLHWNDFSKGPVSPQGLVELDMVQVEKAISHAPPHSGWQRKQDEALREVVGKAAPVELNDGRYSPDGKSIAVTAIRKPDQPKEWEALDFELGVIERATGTYRRGAWYREGLRGPICWSPDGSAILFSRPLPAEDKREGGREEPGALRQEWGLGLWSVRPDGTGERLLTTGWSPDWR
jgi:hypothetical protein